jgi:acetyl-CoA carboxylase alpha subunit
MSRIGTDVVALAAILGSGAVAGAVTLAMVERSHQPAVADCVAASVMPAPRIVVESGHGRHSIVIAPRLHVRATDRCGVVIVDEMIQEDLDRALAELDESRVKLERVYEQDLERRLNEEMARLEEELARLGDDVGR